MKLSEQLLKHIEKTVGLSIETIKEQSPEETMRYFEKKNSKPFKFTSAFPFIGRGNVLRDDVKTRKEIDAEIDQILKVG